MLQQKASPEAIRRVEELARMQAQQRPEPVTPLVVKAPTRMNAHEESSGSESPAAEEKEKILLKVQNSTQSTQSIRIFTVSTINASTISTKPSIDYMVDVARKALVFVDF